MLEASLRKLVREEAATAAVEALTVVRTEITSTIRTAAAEQFQKARTAFDTYQRCNQRVHPGEKWTMPAQPGPGAERLLTDCRIKALELAIARQHMSEGDNQAVLDTAAAYARFIVDGLSRPAETGGGSEPSADDGGSPILDGEQPA